jgi:hypothetical protein
MSVAVGSLTSLTPTLSHRERGICRNAYSQKDDVCVGEMAGRICPLSRWERVGVREDKWYLNAIQ